MTGTKFKYQVYGGKNTPDLHKAAGVLPPEVMEWSGIGTSNPNVVIGHGGALATFNDSGTSFEEIAQGIEDSL